MIRSGSLASGFNHPLSRLRREDKERGPRREAMRRVLYQDGEVTWVRENAALKDTMAVLLFQDFSYPARGTKGETGCMLK